MKYCDVDGVVADWQGRLLEIYGLERDMDVREFLKKGGTLEERFGDIREAVESVGAEFWSGIKVFSWGGELYSRISREGNFCFLTSCGNHSKRPFYAAGGAYGKLIWLSKNFNGASVSICRDKHVHAHQRAVLIDDSRSNVDKFVKHGGRGFLFPHPYLIEDGDVDMSDVYSEIEYLCLLKGN